MEIPDVHYARSGDVAIAHMVVGNGPVDIVFVRGFAGDLLSAWEQPGLVRFITELAKPNERGEAQYFAEKVPGARIVELTRDPGIYHWVDEDGYDLVMRETRTLAQQVQHEAAPQRVLATMLFTDLVGSTERAAELGDSEWRSLLGRHHARVRRCLAKHGGSEVDVAGDGFMGTFDGPGRAIDCACAIAADFRASNYQCV